MSRFHRIVAILVGLVFLMGSVPSAAFACHTDLHRTMSSGATHASAVAHAAHRMATSALKPAGTDACDMQGQPHACAAMASCGSVALRVAGGAQAAIGAPPALLPSERCAAPSSRVAAPDIPPPRA